MKKAIYILFFLLTIYAYAQDSEDSPPSDLPADISTLNQIGFSNIYLGMYRDEVSELLLNNRLFYYRGEEDVVFSPVEQQPVIRCTGSSYIKRGFFFFQDEKLFSISLILDSKKITRYTLVEKLSEKYGKPKEVTPKWVMWENEKYQISIEEPLAVKYLDKEIYSERIQKSEIKEADRIIELDKFYNEF
ncbi:MAG: hypothetical protein JXR63_13950 [Spirochaetales bacterium]|nr:hypothetical protein [Spirochaetales bacterium]